MGKFSEIELFEQLKKEISARYLTSNSASSKDISEWKGADIVNFQEDLFQKTKSSVSEKWFYTYFKSDFKKLPRIDMLNILSQYIGYSGWADFITKSQEKNHVPTENLPSLLTDGNAPEIETNTEPKVKSVEIPVAKKEKTTEDMPLPQPKKKRKWIFPVLLLLLTGVSTAVYFLTIYQKTYEFCFVDADRNAVVSEPIEITVARPGFTPLEFLTENGCVKFPSKEDTLLMTIKSTYYKQDTFKINLRLYQGSETIRLEPDDYKVMLRHYSKSSQSVKERIKMLDQMIADNALIYQVYGNEFFGVEVLSKKQYINLVSLPTTSLKNFILIEAERKDGKIVKIKFKINSDEN